MSLMTDSLPVHDGFVFEDGTAVMMARVVGMDNAAIQQADVSAAECKAYRTNIQPVFGEDSDNDPVETYDSGALTVSSIVYDTLQTSDARWTKDSTGYNLLLVIPATAFPLGDEHYTIECKLTLTDADTSTVWVRWGVFARRIFSS